jgi:hypothetical protein
MYRNAQDLQLLGSPRTMSCQSIKKEMTDRLCRQNVCPRGDLNGELRESIRFANGYPEISGVVDLRMLSR